MTRVSLKKAKHLVEKARCLAYDRVMPNDSAMAWFTVKLAGAVERKDIEEIETYYHELKDEMSIFVDCE